MRVGSKAGSSLRCEGGILGRIAFASAGVDPLSNGGYHRDAVIAKLIGVGVDAKWANSSVPYYVPGHVDIEKNIAEARSMSSLEFVDAVRSGGKWDFKRGGRREYESFGNWHFGIVARAWLKETLSGIGLSDSELREIAHRGAGFYQSLSGTSAKEFGSAFGAEPFGDDPRDYQEVERGWNAALAMENAASTSNVQLGEFDRADEADQDIENYGASIEGPSHSEEAEGGQKTIELRTP